MQSVRWAVRGEGSNEIEDLRCGSKVGPFGTLTRALDASSQSPRHGEDCLGMGTGVGGGDCCAVSGRCRDGTGDSVYPCTEYLGRPRDRV